ncbi:hypothetical protein [Salinarimonas soli]|uniref:Uncharacterized protein n=1 Tax=Salinarimonas soli TaxID=1638099 RepID=A0A5B2VE49_9HYPH|nr:hypothetical protein [Salinarimonas soli]KAA2236427.1 hypothetical protein F0L46_14895 [Salinarimonas soli]
MRGATRAYVLVTLLFGGTCLPRGATAQPLEDALLTLIRFGAESVIVKREPGLIVTGDSPHVEVRVLDQENCVVRVTDLDWKPTREQKMLWGGPATVVENTDSTHRDYFLGRVIASEIKKVSSVLERVAGRVTRERKDAKWLLVGNHGDETQCIYFPASEKHCTNQIEFDRADEQDRAARSDKALVRIFGDLCRGTTRKTPF